MEQYFFINTFPHIRSFTEVLLTELNEIKGIIFFNSDGY